MSALGAGWPILQDVMSGEITLEPMHGRQQTAAIVVAIGVLLLVLELVRRRKLREEYSWLWATTAMLLIVLAMYEGFLVELSRLIGAASTVSTLFFGALLFLLALSLQFSVRLSRLTHRNRTLAQRLSLLEQEIQRQRGEPAQTAPPELESPPAGAGEEVRSATRARRQSKPQDRDEVA